MKKLLPLLLLALTIVAAGCAPSVTPVPTSAAPTLPTQAPAAAPTVATTLPTSAPTTAATTAATMAATTAATTAPTTAMMATPMAPETPSTAMTPASAPTSTAGTTPAGTVSPSSAATGLVVSQNNTLGQFLTDNQGRTLYVFLNDKGTTSTCYDSCAQIWPPLVMQTTPTVGTGVNASLIGTTTRTDGSTQITYNGHPLYYYSGDKAPGDTNGQGIKGIWFVVTPAGIADQAAGGTSAAPATTPTPY